MKYLGKVASTWRKVIRTHAESWVKGTSYQLLRLTGRIPKKLRPMKMPVTAAKRQNFACPTISFMVSLTWINVNLQSKHICYSLSRWTLKQRSKIQNVFRLFNLLLKSRTVAASLTFINIHQRRGSPSIEKTLNMSIPVQLQILAEVKAVEEPGLNLQYSRSCHTVLVRRMKIPKQNGDCNETSLCWASLSLHTFKGKSERIWMSRTKSDAITV